MIKSKIKTDYFRCCMKQVESKYQCVPFWSWNDELDEKELCKQIEWMRSAGIGGFFMHARGGLKTEYLGEKWFSCVKACAEKAGELGMHAYAYDENGWPSGFVGGKLLEDIENHDKYIEHRIGAFDDAADVSYDISGEELKRTTGGENCLNLYIKYSTSTADILNPEVVDKFLALTHEEYKKRDNYGLKGFFTDEPQYFRWGTPFTKVLPSYYKETYGEDIMDKLGLLFVEKKGYREFRYRYWTSMQKLMLKNFAEKVYLWCDKNGYKLTGHYVEETSFGDQIMCCGGVMPFYEYEHIPGVDKLGRTIESELSTKQLGSVCAQLNKKQALTETFACVGWDATPKELKHIAEYQYVNGVNIMCQHLLPFTEHGQRKRDYPEHFSAVNPWVKKDFKTFNDYFSVLGKTLSESTEIVNAAVLHPIRSAYFDYKRDAGDYCVSDINNAFIRFVETLGAKQIPHHYIDETILSKYGKVDGDKLICGKCAYEYLIIPKIYTMDKTTEKLLKEYVLNGGKVYLADKAPEYLEGEKHDYGYLKSNVTLEEIKQAQPVMGEENENIRFTHRVGDDGKEFIYCVNLGGATKWRVSAKTAKSFKVYDILNDEYKTLSGDIIFKEYQSYLLYFDGKKQDEKKDVRAEIRLKDAFTVKDKVDNYMTLDYVSYSFDGKNYSEPLHHMGVFNEMLEKRYKGELYLKYEFNAKEKPERCELLIENTNLLSVAVNGKKAIKTGVSDVEKELYVYDIAGAVKVGKNEVVAKINYYQGENVYYALFGENVTESLKNCLAYDTDIEAAYLKGDFGVYGDFTQGKGKDILLGNNFYLGKQGREITCLIKDGFPFFRGDITLKQKIAVDDTNAKLVIDGRFHLIEVKVNGKYTGKMLFDNELDLSRCVKKGENEIELTLTVGNRNLLGPFHTEEEEPFGVGPYTFERFGTWKNGKSELVKGYYAFVKTIV